MSRLRQWLIRRAAVDAEEAGTEHLAQEQRLDDELARSQQAVQDLVDEYREMQRRYQVVASPSAILSMCCPDAETSQQVYKWFADFKRRHSSALSELFKQMNAAAGRKQ